ncbi:MAG: 30S ribosomal protein S20 [Verrucomicrobia bacterium]|nr:30S ribosomal protein S20 [Verrucomicrobiota bacterium]
MADEASNAKKQVKAPTAAKRHKQDLKKSLRNRAAKSKIKTARTVFTTLTTKEEKTTHCNLLYSHLDRAVKKGLFSKNKAARLKSRLAAQVAKA